MVIIQGLGCSDSVKQGAVGGCCLERLCGGKLVCFVGTVAMCELEQQDAEGPDVTGGRGQGGGFVAAEEMVGVDGLFSLRLPCVAAFQS